MKTMEDYELRCTVKQTRRAWKLGAPITIVKLKRTKETIFTDDVIEFDNDTFTYVVPPTTQQMIGWLEEKIGLNIYCLIANKQERFSDWYCYLSRKEAELAAIDAALDYLEKGGTK